MDFSPSKSSSVNVLLCCTGSVAALKVPLLVEKLMQLQVPLISCDPNTTNCQNSPGKNISAHSDSSYFEINTRVVTTENAKHFYDCSKLGTTLYEDKDEWLMWNKRNDPVLHIELRRWADILVIAPLDANTLAKVSNGICDNLLTCVVRAWDCKKPLFFAPAMNTHMYDHPLTAKQISLLKEIGYKEIPCIDKVLICGDKGLGAMAEVETILLHIVEAITSIKS